jgi:putative ABC transport system substrate-binding protein
LGVLGGAAAATMPLAHAQQPRRVVGLLATSSADALSGPVSAIHLALRQSGLEVGQAVRMEYRYANDQIAPLPALAAELVKIPTSVLITSGPRAALTAKAATTTIPIVFGPLPDPVRSGLVASWNKPDGNITGVAALTTELDAKRLELLHELSPGTGPLGVLLNSARPDTQAQLGGIENAGRSIGRELVLAYASTGSEIDMAIATFASRSIVGLLVAADPFFTSQRTQIVRLVAHHGWPAIYQWREFADVGGLASYGSNYIDSWRQVGLYAARILKGEKPAELPVQQPTKFEFVVNLRTARKLGLTITPSLLGRADEVIE